MQVGPEISPEGRFIAHASAEGGPYSVYVSEFPSGQGKWQLPHISTALVQALGAYLAQRSTHQ